MIRKKSENKATCQSCSQARKWPKLLGLVQLALHLSLSSGFRFQPTPRPNTTIRKPLEGRTRIARLLQLPAGASRALQGR